MAPDSYSSYFDDGTYTFRDSTKLTLQNFLGSVMMNTMEINELDNFVSIGEWDIDSLGSRKTTYRQYHYGYPVEATQINVISKKGIVMHVNGFWLPNFKLGTPSAIDESIALDSAMAYIGAPLYNWQDSAMEEGIKHKLMDITDTVGFYDSTATLRPHGKLVIAHPYGDGDFADQGKYALCWKLYITPMKWDTAIIDVSTDTVAAYDTIIGYRCVPTQVIYVNAETGAVYSYDHYLYSAGMSTSHVHPTYYCGDHDIRTYKHSGTHELRNDDYSIFCYGPNPPSSSTIQTLTWLSDTWSGQHTNTTAYWALQAANRYFGDAFGVNASYRGARQDIYTDRTVYLDEDRVGYFNGDEPVILGGSSENVDKYYFSNDNSSIAPSAAHLDVVCHEFTHALIRHGANFDNFGEPGAVMEGFCDYLGSVAASSIMPSVYSSNWTQGFGYQTNEYARHFYSPSSDWPNASIESYDYYTPYIDKHLAGGIFRKYTSLLESGGTYNSVGVIGIGNQDYNNFHALHGFMWNHQNYHQTRNQFLQYYEYVYGRCSPQWISCARAWHALGVGPFPICDRTLVVTDGIAEAESDHIIRGMTGLKHAVGGNQPGIRVAKTEEAMQATIVSYNWTIPTEWSITYNSDSSEFGIDSVTDLTSRMVHCVITFSDSVQDTVSTFMHFNDLTPPEKHIGHASPAVVADANIKLFPNPVKRQLNIQLGFQPTRPCRLSVTDCMGREVYNGIISSANCSIFLPELPSGIYISRIKGEDKDYINKIEIKN